MRPRSLSAEALTKIWAAARSCLASQKEDRNVSLDGSFRCVRHALAGQSEDPLEGVVFMVKLFVSSAGIVKCKKAITTLFQADFRTPKTLRKADFGRLVGVTPARDSSLGPSRPSRDCDRARQREQGRNGSTENVDQARRETWKRTFEADPPEVPKIRFAQLAHCSPATVSRYVKAGLPVEPNGRSTSKRAGPGGAPERRPRGRGSARRSRGLRRRSAFAR